MSDDYRDPSGNTEAFRAFVSSDAAPAPEATPAPAATNRMPLLIGGAVLAVVVIVILVFALS
jgi:hypothetical protein